MTKKGQCRLLIEDFEKNRKNADVCREFEEVNGELRLDMKFSKPNAEIESYEAEKKLIPVLDAYISVGVEQGQKWFYWNFPNAQIKVEVPEIWRLMGIKYPEERPSKEKSGYSMPKDFYPISDEGDPKDINRIFGICKGLGIELRINNSPDFFVLNEKDNLCEKTLPQILDGMQDYGFVLQCAKTSSFNGLVNEESGHFGPIENYRPLAKVLRKYAREYER